MSFVNRQILLGGVQRIINHVDRQTMMNSCILCHKNIERRQERSFTSLQGTRSQQLLKRHCAEGSLLLGNTKRCYTDGGGNETGLDYFVFYKLIDLAGDYLTSVHEITGLGWCPTIVLATLPLRLIISVCTRYYSINGMVTIREMGDEVKAYMEERAKEFKGHSWKKKYPFLETERDVNRYLHHLAEKKRSEIIQRNRMNQGKIVLVSFQPLLLWISMSAALRRFSGSPTMTFTFPPQWNTQANGTVLTDFATDGILWFTDLALPDPYHVLPVLTGLGFLTLNMLSRFYKQPSTISVLNPRMRVRKAMLDGIHHFLTVWSVVAVALFWNAPASMQFYWASSSLIALATSGVLMHPKVQIKLVKPEKRDYALQAKVVADKPPSLPFFKKKKK